MLDAARVHTWRAMLLCAIGALTGLGIAGYGLFTASGTSTRTVPPENLAMVNGRPILRSDFINQLESETGKKFDQSTRAEQLKVLDEMVREELLVQRGLELDFAETDQGARNALVSSVSDSAIAEITTSEPTEAQLRAYYAAHPGQWSTDGTMTLRDLVLPTSAAWPREQAMRRAAQAVQELRAGAAVGQVSARYGLTDKPPDDEQYYFAVQYRFGDEFFARLRTLTDGAVSDPAIQADGIHIVKVLGNRQPIPLSFEAARSQLRTDYIDAMQTQLMDNTVRFLRRRARILIAPDYATEYRP
jgi:parvulin-like peptidyl-prolyl isomerase